jgi:hypothetical protein
MASKTISSDKSETKVGTAETKIYTATRTTYNVDTNGKIDPKSVKHELVYYDAPLSPGVVAATSTGTSNDWTFANKPLSNTPYLGADAQKSLKEGALKATTQQQIQTAATKEKIPPEQQKALSTKQVNTAQEQEDAEKQLKAELAKEVDGTRNSFPGANGGVPLKYPRNLANTKQDVIKFRMVKYSPKQLDKNNADKDLSPFSDRRKIDDKNTIGVVVLPIPAGIGDANSVNWGSNETGVFGSQLYNIANQFITGGGDSGTEAAGGAVEGVQNNPTDVKTALSTKFAEAASGTTNMLSRTQGAVYNPNMELLFNGPSLRPFSFTFKLSARSKEEARDIRSIIRFFKQGMSPIRTQSQLFLKAPHTFQLEYLHVGKSHSFLNKFKECALQSFTVDYTPEGQYATFTDGAMVSYQITMQFQELEPIFNDDYATIDQNKDTQIGY